MCVDPSQVTQTTILRRPQRKRTRATRASLMTLSHHYPLEMRRIPSRRHLRRLSKAMQRNALQVPYAVREERMPAILSKLMEWGEVEQSVAMKVRPGFDARVLPTSTIHSNPSNPSKHLPASLEACRERPVQFATTRMSALPVCSLVSWTCKLLPIL